MIVVPKQGRLTLASLLFLGGASPDVQWKLKLFKNDHTPGLNDLPGDYTESAFGGYTHVPFELADNTTPALSGNMARTLLTGEARVWTCAASPETIYGWYLTNEDEDVVLMAERYATPHVLGIGSVHTLYPYVLLGKLLAD